MLPHVCACMCSEFYLFTIPIIPSFTGMTLPISTSIASVPASIRSSLVTTARVLLPEESNTPGYKKNTPRDIKCRKCNCSHLPSGSTSRATLSASEVAMSVFAAVTAKMMEFGLEMNLKINSLIWISMSLG